MPTITAEIAKNLTRVSDIDWRIWEPVDKATLCFVRHGGRMLLIRKKRGLGAGKINAPGGRLEAGETFEQAAVRELEEEVGLKVTNLRYAGQHFFQFTDGYSMHVKVFWTTEFTGEPVESDEAIPMWVSEAEIPYAEMWADDVLWVPLMLKGDVFEGKSVFAGEKMLDVKILV